MLPGIIYDKGATMATKRSIPNRLPFSKTRLEKLAPPERGRIYHYDSRKPGLAICLTSTGTKTFCFYRKVDGRPTRVRIGRFPDLTSDPQATPRPLLEEC